jgi:hypothetical protein
MALCLTYGCNHQAERLPYNPFRSMVDYAHVPPLCDMFHMCRCFNRYGFLEFCVTIQNHSTLKMRQAERLTYN